MKDSYWQKSFKIIEVGGSSVGYSTCMRRTGVEGHEFESRCCLLTDRPQCHRCAPTCLQTESKTGAVNGGLALKLRGLLAVFWCCTIGMHLHKLYQCVVNVIFAHNIFSYVMCAYRSPGSKMSQLHCCKLAIIENAAEVIPALSLRQCILA